MNLLKGALIDEKEPNLQSQGDKHVHNGSGAARFRAHPESPKDRQGQVMDCRFSAGHLVCRAFFDASEFKPCGMGRSLARGEETAPAL
jgi:hypothetical protein